jgi:hypothetical protein
MAVASCQPSSEGKNSDDAASGSCDQGKPVTPTETTVAGSVKLLDAPNGHQIVNEKATSILGRTEYQDVDQTERLQELCRAGDWSKVAVLEPEWLRHVTGWIRVSALRKIQRERGGERRYVEADFYWDSTTVGNRAKLVEAVNRAARDHPECDTIDPGTLSKSPSRSKPGKPIYFVTCTGSAGDVFNIWFDIEGKTAE